MLNLFVKAQTNNNRTLANTITHNNTEDYLYHDDTNNSYHNENWVDAEEETRICRTSTCVRKCCPKGKYLSLYLSYGCVDQKEGDPKFELQFQHKDGRPTVPDKPIHFLYGSDLKICPTYGLLPEHRDAILLNDGSLYTSHENIYRNASRYCLDVIKRDDVKFGMWSITCYKRFEETPRTLFRYYGHVTCLVLSSVSLLVIIICHVALPKLRDLSGLCLLSYASWLFVADVALLVVSLDSKLAMTTCIIFGLLIHSFFLAAYTWLTIICFDIWRIVRRTVIWPGVRLGRAELERVENLVEMLTLKVLGRESLPTGRSGGTNRKDLRESLAQGVPKMSVKGVFWRFLQQQEKRLFVYYCILVWGSILVITIITCTLQFLPPDALPEYIVRPHFGVNRCFIIQEDANLLAYFYSILAVLGLLNILLISKTVYYLYEGGVKLCCCRKTVPSSGDDVLFNNKDLDMFWQRFQIFAMTVVVWTTEIFSWKIPPKEMW
ncbi:Methuselah N-terminal domain [Trinorchestia longiramus]|nr:Methuselah N-terminal domain [Trinorchestia longiramus]